MSWYSKKVSRRIFKLLLSERNPFIYGAIKVFTMFKYGSTVLMNCEFCDRRWYGLAAAVLS